MTTTRPSRALPPHAVSQFLFREADIGRPKATVAAEFIMKRVPSCRVTPHQCLIQTKDPDWFRQFGVVIGGLDKIIARRWMNATLCSLVSLDADGEIDDPATIIPYIDGGTEGFGGQVRRGRGALVLHAALLPTPTRPPPNTQVGVMLPRITACFECTMNLFPPPVTFAMCTIAETPRKPEHCIAYVMMKTWDASFPDRKLDADNPEDVSWVLAKALERGAAYGIEGVTHALTLGVLKNIIPAIASTNALVASLCVLEALKLLSFASQTLDNYCTYRGSEGTYSRTYANERAPSCAACAPSPSVHLTLARSMTLEGLVQQLKTLPALQLPAPSLGMPGKLLYNPRPHGAQVAYFASNLAQTLPELGVNDGDVITCTDAELASLTSLCVHIKYEE